MRPVPYGPERALLRRLRHAVILVALLGSCCSCQCDAAGVSTATRRLAAVPAPAPALASGPGPVPAPSGRSLDRNVFVEARPRAPSASPVVASAAGGGFPSLAAVPGDVPAVEQCDIYVKVTCTSTEEEDAGVACGSMSPPASGGDRRCERNVRLAYFVQNVGEIQLQVLELYRTISGGAVRDLMVEVEDDMLGPIPAASDGIRFLAVPAGPTNNFFEIGENATFNVCEPSNYRINASVRGYQIPNDCVDDDLVDYVFPYCSDNLNIKFILRGASRPKGLKTKRCRWLAKQRNTKRRKICRKKKDARVKCPATCAGNCCRLSRSGC